MTMKEPAKIRWAPRLRPLLLKRLYDSDAEGFRDLELCDKVGFVLYARCHTFVLVRRQEVECPECSTAFKVASHGRSQCPREGCDWYITLSDYGQSVRNHYAYPGRAMDAYLSFYRHYPKAKTYPEKLFLIDRLIHSFHVDEKTGESVKSVASKLLEGSKKAVVRFLDDLSALNPEDKQDWRRTVTGTIDGRVLRTDPLTEG